MIWTHNDSGDGPILYALDRTGRELGAVTVAGASALDWEDMEISDCADGTCLYVADVGDNAEERPHVVVYRIPEPDPYDETSADAVALTMRYPDGPRDAEAIYVLPGERLHVVSKGRSDEVAVYRYPGAPATDTVVTLERVQGLTNGERPSLERQVTGASASVDGRTVAVRTYTSLSFYAVVDGELVGEAVHTQSLRTLAEPQGEAVGLGSDGAVVLTSEGARGNAPSMSMLRCEPEP